MPNKSDTNMVSTEPTSYHGEDEVFTRVTLCVNVDTKLDWCVAFNFLRTHVQLFKLGKEEGIEFAQALVPNAPFEHLWSGRFFFFS